MDPVTGIITAKAIQGVTDVISAATTKSENSSKEDFATLMKGILQPKAANQVNEEELFAALVQERIIGLKGEEAGTQYQELLKKTQDSLQKPNGYIPVEEAANQTLELLVTDGIITKEESEQIATEAFNAAQLDDNLNALWDGQGSAEDPTIALMEMESALLKAEEMLTAFDKGEAEPTPRPEGTTTGGSSTVQPKGNELDGAGEGFLFKPESENGGALVVLLPAQLAHQVENVFLKDANGNILENGRSSGYANADRHGEREHFRFSRSGSDYPQNITVEIQLQDGTIKTYEIPDPSQRYD